MNYLFLFFVIIPVVEMRVLIEVGSLIGAVPTIGLVLLTAVIGIALLKQQGFATLFRAQQKIQQGQIPAQEMAEGILLAVGGALLLTPGFVTDGIGFACLIPGPRHLLLAWGMKHFKSRVHIYGQGTDNQDPNNQSSNNQSSNHQGTYRKASTHKGTVFDQSELSQKTTLEGEFHREDKDDKGSS